MPLNRMLTKITIKVNLKLPPKPIKSMDLAIHLGRELMSRAYKII